MTIAELVDQIVTSAIEQSNNTDEERFSVAVDLSAFASLDYQTALLIEFNNSTRLHEAGLQLASVTTSECNFTKVR